MSGSASGKNQWKGILILLLTAFIWGSSFVAQSVGMENVDAFTFSAVRTLLGAVVLVPVVLLRLPSIRKNAQENPDAGIAISIRRGAMLGIILFIAQNLQQFAFYYSTSGKIGLITALYMFFVPLIGLLFKKRISVVTWLCIVAAFIGLCLLSIPPEGLGALNRGDLLALLCSICFAVHILTVEKYAAHADGILLSCVQFFVSGLIAAVLMFVFESPHISEIKAALPALMYSGFLSCGVAYTLQIVGQKYTEASLASLLLCLEAVFALLCGAIILHERLSGRELAGSLLMLAAILISQLFAVRKPAVPPRSE